ncbi:sugar phosphate nucleotidyltransferase [Methylococcus geothermalis]|uniref:NTP transferase domain-containing protein n=1 Tax=Methylococcus geothermalis TaxID=2681310 RepID=A0A858Q9N7_9GAMM|nr:NDP-sugar synthase [Methylococcus geothermalis]QJD30396.1 NTP transferase domain-containing protein [Methylococcus geothermalis]
MRVIVLADRIGRELLPLTDRTCVALLPVAAKPLIDYTLDMLAATGLTEALIVAGPFGEQIRAHLGEGRHFGLRLEYWPSPGETEVALLLSQLPKCSEKSTLVVRGDMLRSPLLGAFLKMAGSRDAPVLHGWCEGNPGGLWLLRGNADDTCGMDWRDIVSGTAVPESGKLKLEGGTAHPLDSLPAYHRTNLDAAGGRIGGLALPGQQAHAGLTVGRNSSVSAGSLANGTALIGSHCRIHPSVQLQGENVISDGVIVDRGARLSNTVVLPYSYVGELVTVENGIVRGNDLLRIDTGARLRIVDAFLLADLDQVSITHGFSDLLNRLAGVLLLVASAPLWPLAALAALARHPTRPLRFRRLRGNRLVRGDAGTPRRAAFTAAEWATGIPVLAKLPWLLPVARGDLHLVGVEPVTPEQAASRTAEWERMADRAPAGLIGPTQLDLPASAPAEERLMSDAFFAAQADSGKKLRVILRGLRVLFSRRAWRPED